METLYQVANSLGLSVTTTTGNSANPDHAYLVEIRGGPGEVYAQGYGRTVEAAAAACLADFESGVTT
jgi:hypothetical protein